jgi:hypothetical protein
MSSFSASVILGRTFLSQKKALSEASSLSQIIAVRERDLEEDRTTN